MAGRNINAEKYAATIWQAMFVQKNISRLSCSSVYETFGLEEKCVVALKKNQAHKSQSHLYNSSQQDCRLLCPNVGRYRGGTIF